METFKGRDKKAAKAAQISVYSNTFLLATKLLVGLIMSSIAVISEAIHSGIDLLAALIARYSVRQAWRPADKTHRFGHGKYESLSGILEALLILLAAGIIIYEALIRLLNKVEIQVVEVGIVIMGLSAVLNFFVSRYLMRVARECESLSLEADALHLRTDVWTSLGVFAGLILIRVSGIVEIDSFIALFVAVLIINAALRLSQRTARELLDHSLTAEEETMIDETIIQFAGELATYHHLRTRRSGRKRFVDFHLVVPKNLSVEKAHELCDAVENEMESRLRDSDVTIHIEPCDEECIECMKKQICKDRDVNDVLGRSE